MTMRFCGNLKIDIRLHPHLDEYTCKISANGKHLDTQVVGASADVKWNHRLEKPETYDSVAHAALSFSADEGHDVTAYADLSDSGWIIRRTA